MKVLDADWLMNQEESGLMLGASAPAAFPKLSSGKPSGGFFEPFRCLQRFLVWLWLVERITEAQRSAAVTSEVLQRSVSLYDSDPVQNYREHFDYFLISACICVGAFDLARQVAEKMETDREVISTYGLCARILVARLFQEREHEITYMSALKSLKGSPPPIRVGSRAAWEAFVLGKNERLALEATKVCRTFSEKLLECATPEQRQSKSIEMGYWSLNSFWPWPELVLLKLAFGCEAVPEIDDFWIPASLLKKYCKDANP